jgi:hypothetical protein
VGIIVGKGVPSVNISFGVSVAVGGGSSWADTEGDKVTRFINMIHITKLAIHLYLILYEFIVSSSFYGFIIYRKYIIVKASLF